MKIDYHKEADLGCVMLCDLGFYGAAIAAKYGLTKGQVYSRTKKAGRKFRDYRMMRNWAAKVAIGHIDTEQRRERIRDTVLESLAEAEKERAKNGQKKKARQ